MVDATSGFQLLTYTDVYSGYNQIKIHVADQEHTSFEIDKGIYWYKVMPFRLKNDGSMYWGMVRKMFKNVLGKNMDVYVDDMLIKLKISESPCKDLEQAFAIIRE
uniref:Reverse transcriptase domain-containing protein n=1 Tax=Cannabis sativa TaxID=3483 RepID=A0A803QCM7_CANSA